jgi:hypothetical protein
VWSKRQSTLDKNFNCISFLSIFEKTKIIGDVGLSGGKIQVEEVYKQKREQKAR